MATGPLCGMCCRPIHDRYILQVMDVFYHEHCLQCFACGERLYQTCYFRDSKLFCKLDYDRIYSKKCLGCSERISPEELVMKTCDSVFHVRCFACVVCGMRLQKGDQYVFKQGQVFCKPDYEKEVEMLQGYNQGDFFCDEFTQSSRSSDGRRGPKRPRTILTTQQRRAFKASFEISPKPSRKVRENLAKDTGLSVRIVQVWFQNQRAKVKKMQKKARQDNKDVKDVENDEKKLGLKEEEQSPRSSSFLNDSCSNDADLDSATIGLFQQMQNDSKHFLHIKQETENDENFFKNKQDHNTQQIAESLHNKYQSNLLNGFNFGSNLVGNHGATLFLSPPPAHQNPPHLNVMGLNPIDRLYSMQNQYFCEVESAPLE